jgi:hypothetical protein
MVNTGMGFISLGRGGRHITPTALTDTAFARCLNLPSHGFLNLNAET